MRPLTLSIGALTLVLGTAWAQNTGEGSSSQQLPVGQTFKNFEFPIYQDGQLKATLQAAEATGITLNRAATTDLKIEQYENGAVITTVTSPKADLYVNERKMRTKDTVLIVRADTEASAQSCDFDLQTKKYLLRTNVRVVLKNFDLGTATNPASGSASPAAASSPTTAPDATTKPPAPRPASRDDSLLELPGSYSSTNSAPLPPTSPDTK